MASYVLMRKSTLASENGYARRTLALSRAALSADTAIPPRIRALALRQAAHGHAMLGEPTQAFRLIEEARDAIAGADPDDPLDSQLAGYCLDSYLMAEQAACLTELSRPHEAAATFERTLAAWPDLFQRDKGLCLAKYALAAAQADDIERAQALARDAIAVLRTTGSARTLHYLRITADQMGRRGAQQAAASVAHALRALPFHQS